MGIRVNLLESLEKEEVTVPPTIMTALEPKMEEPAVGLEGASDVTFNYQTIKWIISARWILIKLERMEDLLRGDNVDCSVPEEWFHMPFEVNQIYGPLDTESQQFIEIFNLFENERFQAIISMMEFEDKIIALMFETETYPSTSPDLQEMAQELRNCRQRLEEALTAQVEVIVEEPDLDEREMTVARIMSHDMFA